MGRILFAARGLLPGHKGVVCPIRARRGLLRAQTLKTLTGHSTDAAFERYFHRDLDYVRQVQAKLKRKVLPFSGSKQGQGQK